MILRLNLITEMKNLTTGILGILILCFFSINVATAQDSWDENTFMIRFDPSIPQDTIDSIRVDYLAEELWVSPLTETRLWHVEASYPHWNLAQTDYFIDVQQNSAHARGKTGSQGGSGLNYGVISGSLNNLYNGTNGGGSGGPANPDPTNPDDQMNCHDEMSTFIPTGSNPVKVGIFDTGASEFDFFHGYQWMYAFDQTGYNYMDPANTGDYRDWNGHGNHIASTIAHLTHKAHGIGYTNQNPDVAYRQMKTFTAAAQGPIAEIILAFETEVLNGLQIANFSWRFVADEGEANLHPLKKTIEVAEDLYDVLIVCAAGNDGQNIDDGITYNGLNGLNAYPASYDFENILSVATFNCQNYFTDFSNTGASNVDIAAPGLEIPGIWTDNFGQYELDYLSGTSMSCAITTAAAVQLATHQTSFDAQEIKCAIIQGAEYMPLMDPFLVSAGVLNVDNARGILGNCNNGGGNGGPKRSLGFDNTNESAVNLGVAPNPSFGEIALNIDSGVEGISKINIFNNVGKMVFQKNIYISSGINNIDLDLNVLDAGLYNLILDYGSGTEAHKISILK